MLLILSTSLFSVYSVSFGLRLVRQPLNFYCLFSFSVTVKVLPSPGELSTLISL